MKARQPATLDSSQEVKRRIKLPRPVNTEDAQAIESALNALPGLRETVVDPHRHSIHVTYDVSQADYQMLSKAIGGTGYSPTKSWWSRCRRSWFAFTENNIRENAKAPPSPCCNKPPK